MHKETAEILREVQCKLENSANTIDRLAYTSYRNKIISGVMSSLLRDLWLTNSDLASRAQHMYVLYGVSYPQFCLLVEKFLCDAPDREAVGRDFLRLAEW